MSNLIPDKVKQWMGLVLSVLVVALGAASEWAELGPDFVRWVGRAALLLVVVSNVLGLSVPSIKPKVGGYLAVLALALALMLSAGCPNAYRAGWVATASTLDARDAVDDGIKSAFEVKVKECVDRHAEDQIQVQQCMEGSQQFKAAQKWTVYAYPAITSSVKTARAVLEIAEKVQASKDSATKKVLSALKTGVCALLSVIAEWKDLFPGKAKVALGYLDLFDQGVCK